MCCVLSVKYESSADDVIGIPGTGVTSSQYAQCRVAWPHTLTDKKNSRWRPVGCDVIIHFCACAVDKMLLIRKVEKSLQNPGNSRRVLHAHFYRTIYGVRETTMDNKEYILQVAAIITKQKLNADHVTIYDMHEQGDLDLLYWYISDETKRKKSAMEVLITSSRYIALVQETKYDGITKRTKRYAYKIKLLRYTEQLNQDDVVISYADPVIINRNKIMEY